MAYVGEQKREYQRLWIANRRASWLTGKVCVVCGATEDLEVDHVDPKTKVYNPATLWGMSPSNPKRIAELAKCQVLCHFHHIEKTVVNGDKKRDTCYAGHKFKVVGQYPDGRCVECKRVQNSLRDQSKVRPG